MINEMEKNIKMPLKCPTCGEVCGYVDSNGYGTVYLICKCCDKERIFYHVDESVFCKTDK